jgi:hypothetical protein
MVGSTGPDITTYVDSSVAAGTAYTYRVCAYNAAGASAYSPTASATAPSAANAAPTISAIPAVSLSANGSSAPIAFTVGDAETAAGFPRSHLLPRPTPHLLPLTGILLGGSGASRTVTLTPASNQSGSASVTLTVSDGVNIATSTFTVTVNASPTPRPPSATSATARLAPEPTPAPLPLRSGTAQTAAASLVVTANSSNQTLVPDANIVLAGSGANRTISLQPAVRPVRSGDHHGARLGWDRSVSSDSFVLTVTCPQHAADDQRHSQSGRRLRMPAPARSGTRWGMPRRPRACSRFPPLRRTRPSCPCVRARPRRIGLHPHPCRAAGDAGQSGTATITVTVSDGASTGSDSFVLTGDRAQHRADHHGNSQRLDRRQHGDHPAALCGGRRPDVRPPTWSCHRPVHQSLRSFRWPTSPLAAVGRIDRSRSCPQPIKPAPQASP